MTSGQSYSQSWTPILPYLFAKASIWLSSILIHICACMCACFLTLSARWPLELPIDWLYGSLVNSSITARFVNSQQHACSSEYTYACARLYICVCVSVCVALCYALCNKCWLAGWLLACCWCFLVAVRWFCIKSHLKRKQKFQLIHKHARMFVCACTCLSAYSGNQTINGCSEVQW